MKPALRSPAVNGRRWPAARLREAIAATEAPRRGPARSIERLVEYGDRFSTVNLRYADPLR